MLPRNVIDNVGRLWPTFIRVAWIWRVLTPDSFEVVLDPVVEVEHKLPDGVRETCDLA
jgi:hypothetical protein